MAKSKSEKKKSKEVEVKYIFPDAVVNGKQGIAILATSQEEAQSKLNKILNPKNND